MRLDILGQQFNVIEMPLETLQKYRGPTVDKNDIIQEYYSVDDKIIYLGEELDRREKDYGLFHAVWEILLYLCGMGYDHAGFTNFSGLLFSVLRRNDLAYLFQGTVK